MNCQKLLLTFLSILLIIPYGQSQNLNELKTAIFPNDGPTAYDASNFTFTKDYHPSNVFWASPFSESTVYHALLKYDHPTNPDQSYQLRLGKGGQIYSFITSAGETVPPQYPATAPWVDEVWQMVAVDGTLNKPNENKKYFIHQAGVYLKNASQSVPFFSPVVADYYDSNHNSYTIVNWGQQAHTADNLISGYTSSVLYYTRFKNLGNGIIQVDLLMYNFGDDTMDFINIPWGGVRRSTYDHWFSSNTDHTYQEETGTFTSYSEPFTNTGGWAAFSSDAAGNAPSLGLLMDNSEGTLRMGDAGSIANRDYTVFEGIKFPGTKLQPGKALRARNFYILDADIDDIKSSIINKSLDTETVYEGFNKDENEVDSTAYVFEYQGNELVAVETNFTEGLNVKLRPYLNSEPLFIIKSTDEEYRITSDLHTYSALPYDGKLDTIQLLGFVDDEMVIEMQSATICSGESYTFPDGTNQSNITATYKQYSNVGTAVNGYDSLIFTIVYVSPNDVPQTTYVNNGPGGVGSTNGASSLTLWLDANQLLGKGTTNPVNGTSVGKWIDLSGYQDHYSSSGVNQPTFNSAGTFAAVQFNAAAMDPQYLTGTNMTSHSYGAIYMALNAVDGGSINPLLSNTDFSLQYEQTSNSGFMGYSDIGSTDYTSTLATTFGTDNIISFHVNCGTNNLDIQSANNVVSLPVGNTTNGLPLGQLGTLTERPSGDFYEIIAFKETLNTAQKILIDNYLSAKYASVTIANDIYDEDDVANGNFDKDVAGIGRVDANNLHDNARGTGVVTIANPTDLDDDEFLIWGSNDGALTFTDATDIPVGLTNKMPRIWRISEVNTSSTTVDVGTVDMTFDLEGVTLSDLESVVLLIDVDGDGSFADETYIKSNFTESTDYEGQAFVHFNNVHLQDGYRFTLAYLEPSGPGGVFSNLALWLAADKEVSTLNGTEVVTWKDQSENKRVGTGGFGPSWSTSTTKMLNYNPVVTLDGVDDQIGVSGGITGGGTYTDFNIFIVHRLNAAPHQSTIFRESLNGGGISSHLPWSNGRVFWDAGLSSGDGRLHVPSGLSSGDAAIWGFLSHDGTTDVQAIRKTGELYSSDNTAVSITGDNSSFYIGSTGSGLYSEGDVAEVIAYVGNTEMTGIEVQKIESYLAIKYGFTLDNSAGGTAGDLLNSAGNTIWDADVAANYHNEVICIVRDDASAFYQKQSTTTDGKLTMYMGNIAAYNSLNTNTISTDQSSIVIGNNQGLLYDSNPGGSTEQPSGIQARFEREWKVTNTNFSDDYTLKFEWAMYGNFDINDIRLLVDDDGDFSNAQIVGAPDVTITEGSIIISGIDPSVIPMNSTRYITIGSVNAATSFLPVELLSFKARINDYKVDLVWQTASEIDNDYFTIERSKDTKTWEVIGTVAGNGTTTTTTNYELQDPKPLFGQSYYRLKQTDFDGSYVYSLIESVLLTPNSQELQLYPNPTKNTFSINRNSTELGRISIYNSVGQEVTNLIIQNNYTNRVEVDLSQLSDGFYFIKTDIGVGRIVKQ